MWILFSSSCLRLQKTHTKGIECEHGEQECEVNTIIACGLEMLNLQEDRVKFAACVLSRGAEILTGPGHVSTRKSQQHELKVDCSLH